MSGSRNITLVDNTRRMIVWLAQNLRIGQKVRALIDAPTKLEAVVEPRKA